MQAAEAARGTRRRRSLGGVGGPVSGAGGGSQDDEEQEEEGEGAPGVVEPLPALSAPAMRSTAASS
jgi:hypothetical protein